MLRNLATNDWPAFASLIGEDAIIAAKVCILKSKGQSLGQISNKLKKKKWVVRWASEKKCKC